MAGAIAELIRGPLKSDQAHAAAHIDINLIEAGPRLLPTFAPSLSERTKKDLEKLGVKVLLNSPVKAIEHRNIVLSNQSNMPSETVNLVLSSNLQRSSNLRIISALIVSAS